MAHACGRPEWLTHAAALTAGVPARACRARLCVGRRARAAADAGRFVVSPITGELVPIGEMAEHMRISLIDPKWKEQRELMLAKIRCDLGFSG